MTFEQLACLPSGLTGSTFAEALTILMDYLDLSDVWGAGTIKNTWKEVVLGCLGEMFSE